MNNPLFTKFFSALALCACLLYASGVDAGHSSKGLKLLEEVEAGLVGLAEHTLPSVVNISPYVPPSPSIRRQRDSNRSRPTNAGAGVIIDGVKGYIVTNSHVVRHAEKVQITLYGGEELVGQVLGTDEETDLAVVQVESSKPLPSVELGDSSQLKIGQLVVAIGNPYGLHDTFSFGVISGLNRENVNISRYEDFIQTDASINPGNSGGPLLNLPDQFFAAVIIDGVKGYIVTNSHVVRQAEKVQIILYGGEELVGQVLGTDEETDLAVVH